MPSRNPFVHIELNTGDVKAAQSFYQKLFKWKVTPMQGMPYLGIDTGARETGGGIQQKPMPEAATAWLPYVEVKDVKRSIAQARRLGAKIALEYMKLPQMGAIGVLIDPTGAAIGVWSKEPKRRAR